MPTLDCPFCERQNPEDAKFCNACGSPLHLKPCKECGAVDDIGAKACYKCGAPFPARVPKVHSEVALQAVPDPASGHLIELFQGTREATTDYALHQPAPPLRAVGGPSRSAAVTRIGGARHLNQVVLADAHDSDGEKSLRIGYRTMLGALVALLLGMSIAAALHFRGGGPQAEKSAATAAPEPQSEPTRPHGPAGSAGQPQPAAPSAPIAASVGAAPRTAALAAPPEPQSGVATAEPGPRNEAGGSTPEPIRTQEPATAPNGAAAADSQEQNVGGLRGAETPPLKPADGAKASPGKERSARLASSRSHRDRRGAGKRSPPGSGETAVSRAPSASQQATVPSRAPAGTSYKCTEAVAALGLCNTNGK
jgi:hypothetical protein